ncbi:MAG TPA: hypothetical protein VFV49_05395, partial [Thermoanaerobaculia bacterium]|nr:hypothetical protein [Thermoanaerobaculia bacterium]
MKAVFLSILLLISSNAVADCSQWTATTSSQFRTTALDLSVDGNFLWLATGYGVQLFENGRLLDSVPLPGTTRTVRAHGGNGIVYAGSGSSVYVLRRDGRSITTLTSIALSGPVNDLEIVGAALFAAMTGGITHLDILNPAAPVKTNVVLPTSTPFVTSLATAKSKLYAADGDATVEVYSMAIPLLPQHVGTLSSAPRATAVHATPDDEVYISDRFGQNTDIYSGLTFVARLPLVATSFAALPSGKMHFLAGPDRTVRAVDFTTLARHVEVYTAQLPTTNGTVNFVNDMVLVGNTLYVAAGDIGLVTLDTTSIAKPYSQVSYGGPMTNGVRTSGDKAWFSGIGGGITQMRIDPAAIDLVEERTWNAGAGSVVRDYRDNGLLTTNGARATVWALVSATPVQATNVTFDAPIDNAVISNTHLVAMLSNGSVWTAPNGQTTPTQVNVPAMTFLARAGSAIALAEVREADEKTVLHYYATGDFAATPQRFTVNGAAVGSVALDATRAAVFTFEGITVIDLASGNARVVPNSTLVIPRQMAFSGDDLLVMDSRRLLVYDNAQTLVRDHELPAEALAFDTAASIATVATVKGTTAIRYLAELPRPAAPFSNRYYRHFAAGPGRAYLFDDEDIDVISTVLPQRPQYIATIPGVGTIDLTANAAGLFTLSANGTVRAYSPAGMAYAQVSVSEGFDSQAISIHTAGNAVWASIGAGCTIQGCRERKTFVLDPNTLAVTATMTGSVTDVAVSGSRAYALFSIPDEIRVLNVADPLHPAPVVTTQGRFAKSIAYSSGKVYVLAEKVFGYSEATLTRTEEHLTNAITGAAQRLRIDGTCAVISRDADPPLLYDLPSWTLSTRQLALPSPRRSFLMQSP